MRRGPETGLPRGVALFCCALALGFLPACQVLRPRGRAAEPVAALPVPCGRVAFADGARRFALVDFGTLSPPPPGAALKCFSGGEETGILAVGGERQGVFFAADIVSGEPGPGDKVFR